ncbi:hypothetical protein BSKO_05929 [Bryopsis sp. KO-2023]|nr:hypothetical protein BSKO_05929 [Bryopsis sp. KO-2023]
MQCHRFVATPGAGIHPVRRASFGRIPRSRRLAGASTGKAEEAPIAENVSRSSESLSRNSVNGNGNGAGNGTENGAENGNGAENAKIQIGKPRITVMGNAGPTQESLNDLLTTDSGPRFERPYLAYSPPNIKTSELPVMLYLPGEDGTGLAASRQFPSLVQGFDFEALTIPAADRTDFDGLVQIVKEYLKNSLHPRAEGRPLYLLGESFGGLLALVVAAECKDLVDRVVLVNPATSYKDSFLPVIAPLLPQLPNEVYSLLPFAIAPIVGNPIQLLLRNVDLIAPTEVVVEQFIKTAGQMFGTLDFLGDLFDRDLLQWRLTLMQQGVERFDKIILDVQQRCLVVVGEGDWLLPSAKEAERLQKSLPRARTVVLPQRSHVLLQEAGVDLIEIMKKEGFYVTKRVLSCPPKPGKKRDMINNFGSAKGPIEMPSKIELYEELLKPFESVRQPVSPVNFSTLEDGTVVKGFGGLPKDRPLLFVGNHQTLGLDTFLFAGDLIQETDMIFRSLAHPLLTQVVLPEFYEGFNLGPFTPGPTSDPARLGGITRRVTTYGAVRVTGKNFHQLLSGGENVLLYPGGVREAYKLKGEKYKLFWPEQSEFVRMAAKFGAAIIPLAAIGLEDGMEIVFDAEDAKKTPIFGDYVQDQLRKYVQKARKGLTGDVGIDGEMLKPVTVNTIPSRFYFLMQKPIELSKEDYDDREKCNEIYKEVKAEVEGGIEYLQKKREEDPYKDYFVRSLYEATNPGKRAPSFKP